MDPLSILSVAAATAQNAAGPRVKELEAISHDLDTLAYRAFVELQTSSPALAEQLTSGVSEKASGVFLWVSVVTDAIFNGLMDGDSLEDLNAMLEELPADLEDLYDGLWRGIKGKYKQDAAKLFTIFNAFTRSPRSKLNGLPFHLATGGIPSSILWHADGGSSTGADYIT
ncbi:hypothetical protein OQA88_6082 [Cercophora sp. LCS_1]